MLIELRLESKKLQLRSETELIIKIYHKKQIWYPKCPEYMVVLGLMSLKTYLARLKPEKWPRDETSLVVSNLGCRHY